MPGITSKITEAAPEGENEWGLLSNEVGKNPVGESNYMIMETTGKGHYVGVNYFVNSPTPVWYGEGDDMFFIDGAETATLHGTGTEDYFNSSWCPNERYQHAYFGYARVPRTILAGWAGPIATASTLRIRSTLINLCVLPLNTDTTTTLPWKWPAWPTGTWTSPPGWIPFPGKEERKLKPVINLPGHAPLAARMAQKHG